MGVHATKHRESKAVEPETKHATTLARVQRDAAVPNPHWQRLATAGSGALTLGRRNDPLEREADRVADEVMRDDGASVRRMCTGCAEEQATLRRQPVYDEAPGGLVQREAVGAPRSRLRPDATLSQLGPGQDRPGSWHHAVPIPLDLDLHEGRRTAALDDIVAGLGPGEPLPASTRRALAPLSPTPLGDVRIHDDHDSRIAAGLLGSAAFTVSNHIVLGDPATGPVPGRDWLVAHEVAHSIQQQPQTANVAEARGLGPAQLELEADQFANAAVVRRDTLSTRPLGLHPTHTGLARKVIWKHIQDLPNNLLLIIDVDDGDFVGGCVKAIVPHAGVKLIKKAPHTQLFNLHIGFLTNPAGEFCIFFYESVTGICAMMCFPSKEALREAWDKVLEWLKDMLVKLLIALGIAVLIVAAIILAELIAAALAGALLVLLAA